MTNEECKAACDALVAALEEASERLFDVTELLNNGATDDDIELAYRRAYRGNICRAIEMARDLEWRATAKPELPGHDWSESPDIETTQASSGPDDTTTVTQWLGDTPPEPELNDAEKQMVREGKYEEAEVAIWKRAGTIGRQEAERPVDAYRDSLKTCPTGVPENGDWMPKSGERYWIPGKERCEVRWTRLPYHFRRLEAGEVCRTRWIARAVNRRKKAEVAK